MKITKIIVGTLSLATIVLLVVNVVKYSRNIEDFLRSYKLLPEPETFTELYFTDHLHLPSTIYPNQKQVFKVTIHNLENKDMKYPYEVYIDTKGSKQLLDQNSIFLKNNAYKTITENFILINPATRSAVVVNLINKNQSIDFWIEGKR